MRDKYNIREDYRTNTINKAIRKCDNGISTPVSDNLASRDAWEPLPTALIGGELLPAPELDIEGFLPARMAAWVHEASRAKSAPPDYVFFGFLTVCASLIGNTRRAHVQPGWSQPMTFWSMCIGNPSAGKSPALDAVLDPLRSLENSIQGPHKLALAQWSDQKALAELEEKQWKKEVEKALASGAETPPIPEAMNIGTQPKMPRLIIGDATIETVMMICENHPRGILQFRDELSGWLQNMSRYTSSSDRPFWLEAGSGRAYTVDRVAREPVRIPRLLVNVLGGIQPERLQSLLLKSDDDGLLARFIVVWPDAVPLNDDTVTYSERVPRSVYSRLHLMNMEKDDTGDPSPRQIPFSESALSSFRTFRKRIRELESSSSGLMTSFLGKMPGVAATLSLLRSYIWWSEGMPRDEDTEVTDEHVDAVVTMMENYIIPMAYRTYTGFETNKSFAAVRNILHIIATKGWRQFTKRELQRSLGKTSPDSKTLDGYLHELEELDAIRQIPSDGGPGRPSLRYAVNPNSFKLLATS